RRSPCVATRRPAEAPDTCANRGRRAAAAGRRRSNPAAAGASESDHKCIESMADEDGPRVLSVKCEVQEGGVMVSVADTGAGSGVQDIGRIFNPLFTTKSGGMGMGLSICRSIIEAHGGRLLVASNAPRGAVFQFILAAGTAASAAAS